MGRFLSAASGMLVLCSMLAAAPVSATQPASMPAKATLTEMTEVYNTPDFTQPPVAVLTPQVVKISGLEGQWKTKAVNGHTDPIWF